MSVFDELFDIIEESTNRQKKYTDKWCVYRLGLTRNHCFKCSERDGKIFERSRIFRLPEHAGCRCKFFKLEMQRIGKATTDKVNGADIYLSQFNRLPDNYIKKAEAMDMGWKPILGNLDKIAPGKIIGGDVYKDREGVLPEKLGRIWYEADINYSGGYRSTERLIYSNDGLIFKTSNHYLDFIYIE